MADERAIPLLALRLRPSADLLAIEGDCGSESDSDSESDSRSGSRTAGWPIPPISPTPARFPLGGTAGTEQERQLPMAFSLGGSFGGNGGGKQGSGNNGNANRGSGKRLGLKEQWRRLLPFLGGPAYMVAVGYLDPGNWATDLEAARYNFDLLFVVFAACAMAVGFQSLAVRLGVVTGLDLAMAIRKTAHPVATWALYVGAELAIIATDLAEVIGTAIALNLLTNLPLAWGVALTSLDVVLVLAFYNDSSRKWFERITMLLVTVIGICFAILLAKSSPDWPQVAHGLFVPSRLLFTDSRCLFIAMGIIGATVMPHNIYLHSNLVLSSSQSPSQHAKASTKGLISDDREDPMYTDLNTHAIHSNHERFDNSGKPPPAILSYSKTRQTFNFHLFDTAIALTIALYINCSILIVAAAVFHKQGKEVNDIKDAYNLLVLYLGPAAGVIFAVALLFSGQSSTFTGTLCGQIIMEGFLGFQLNNWARRLVTRGLAIIPAMVVALLRGDSAVNDLLVLSQVVLSVQLPFTIWPLVYYTCFGSMMKVPCEVEDDPADDLPRQKISLSPSSSVSSPTTSDVDFIEIIDAASLVDIATLTDSPSSSPYPHLPSTPSTPPKPRTIVVRDFRNGWPMTVFVVLCAVLVTVFNLVMVVQIFMGNSGI